MQYLINKKSVWVIFFVISVFFFSGCYTQLAKPDLATEDEEYYVEDDGYYEDEGEESEKYYEESEEEYEDEDVKQVYYDINYYGYYGPSWGYDPFFDPFFYRYPYSSRVSIYVDYYDPFFYDPLIWCGSYRYFYGYYGGPVFGFGFSTFPRHYYSHSYGYYGGYYGGGYYSPGYGFFSGGSSIPVKRRGFSRGGTRVTDNFGRLPTRARDRNSYTTKNTGKSIQSVNVTKIEGTPKLSTYRKAKKSKKYKSPPKDEAKIVKSLTRQKKSRSKNKNSGYKNSNSNFKDSGLTKQKKKSGYKKARRGKKSEIRTKKPKFTRKFSRGKKVVSKKRSLRSKKYNVRASNKQKNYRGGGNKSINKRSSGGSWKGGSSKNISRNSSGRSKSGQSRTPSRGRKR